jgi:hypothetical protein
MPKNLPGPERESDARRSQMVRGMTIIQFREGLNGAVVRERGSIVRGGDETGEWNCLLLFLPQPYIQWDVLASHALNSRNQDRYDVWCSRSRLERAIMRALAKLEECFEDGIEVQINHAGSFVHEFKSWGPKFFGMRASRLMKVLQLARVIPWSTRRIEAGKWLNHEGTSLMLEDREDRFDEWDERGLIVVRETEGGRPRRLTMRHPPSYPGDMEYGGKSESWLYWGR